MTVLNGSSHAFLIDYDVSYRSLNMSFLLL